MSNLNMGGMSGEQKKQRIIEMMEGVSTDIQDMVYRILFCAESGLE